MPQTTAEQNAQLVTGYLEPIWEDNAWNEDVLSPEYTVHDWPSDPMPFDELKARVTALHDAFPDLSVEFDDVIATEEKVVVRWRFTGTHEGEFRGIEPTGKEVQFEGIGIFRVEDGELVEVWTRSDMLGLLDQLGAIPE